MMNGDSKFPLVTAGIPTYENYAGLRTCLENLLKQDYPNLEIFVSDNTRSEPTPEWLRDIGTTHNHIRYVRQPENLGAIGNHSFLLREAMGDYFFWAHDDDELPFNYVSICMGMLTACPEAVLVGPSADRYLDGKYWLTYENWSSDGLSAYERLDELIPDAFTYHWRFEQYWSGVFLRSAAPANISEDFKAQFHLFFTLSEAGSLLHADEIRLTKHTTQANLDRYASGSAYRRHWLLSPFRGDKVESMQQCVPIAVQMLWVIVHSPRLSSLQKLKLVMKCAGLFLEYPVRTEFESYRFGRFINKFLAKSSRKIRSGLIYLFRY